MITFLYLIFNIHFNFFTKVKDVIAFIKYRKKLHNLFYTSLIIVLSFEFALSFMILQWSCLLILLIETISLGLVCKSFNKTKNNVLNQLIKLNNFEPEIYIYFSGPKGAEYQIKMWLPYFKKLEIPFAIIVREHHHFENITQLTTAPVLLCISVNDVDNTMTDSLKLIFYVNNSAKNTHMVRFNHLTHIQLLHGDSDKSPSYSPVSKLYDKLFVSGQAAIDRYTQHNVTILNDSFELIGRPQLDCLTKKNVSKSTRKTIVYAPTWHGDFGDSNYSSLYFGDEIVKSIINAGFNVIVKLHPYTYRDLKLVDMAKKIELVINSVSGDNSYHCEYYSYNNAEINIHELFNRSDALISDISSVASDYLFTEKPFALVDSQEYNKNIYHKFPLSRASYIVNRNMHNISNVIEELCNTDSMMEQRIFMKEQYIFQSGSLSQFEQFKQSVLNLLEEK